MTIRALVLGLLVSIALASLGYINDTWMFFSYIGGDLVPTHAFGLLMIGLLLVNPILRLLRRWQFRPSELVTMLSLALMGSVLAGSAFYWQYPHPFITPIHEHKTNPAWKTKNLLQYVPPEMMVDAQPDSEVVAKYMEGLEVRPGEELQPLSKIHTGKFWRVLWIRFSRAPWANWRTTIIFWTAVMGLCFLGGACAVIIVHRQWSQREHLSYPIATFTQELIHHDDRGAVNPIFRNRQFWLGFGLVFTVLLINGYQVWNKEFISVPLKINCQPLTQLAFFKDLTKVPEGARLLNVEIFFSAVGLAYFLTSEASFSMGISGLLFVLAAMPLVVRGVDLSGGMLSGSLRSHMWFGSYLGMGVVVVYLGRRFYLAVIKRTMFLRVRNPGEVLPREAWAGRILVVASVALVLLLWRIGLHPALGIAFVLLSGLLFVMLARIHVATGLFMIQPHWHPVSILLALVGGYALGPEAIAILALLCTAVTLDTRIAAIPLIANVLRLGDRNKVKPGRLAGWMVFAIVLSLVVSLLFTVALVYDKGVNGMDSGGTRWALTVARFPFQMIERNVNELGAMEMLDAAKEPTTLRRLTDIAPTKYFFGAVGIGVGLVLICSYLRLRFPRWPLHPLMFLVWGTPWMIAYAPSFLLAWMLKGLIMKYGGQKMYYKARPFFVGLVAGEFLAALLWASVGVGYYLQHGTVGESFLVRP